MPVRSDGPSQCSVKIPHHDAEEKDGPLGDRTPIRGAHISKPARPGTSGLEAVIENTCKVGGP